MSDGRLDDALELAERLRDELESLAGAAADNHSAEGLQNRAALVALWDAADDLASRISLTRSDQR